MNFRWVPLPARSTGIEYLSQAERMMLPRKRMTAGERKIMRLIDMKIDEVARQLAADIWSVPSQSGGNALAAKYPWSPA